MANELLITIPQSEWYWDSDDEEYVIQKDISSTAYAEQYTYIYDNGPTLLFDIDGLEYTLTGTRSSYDGSIQYGGWSSSDPLGMLIASKLTIRIKPGKGSTPGSPLEINIYLPDGGGDDGGDDELLFTVPSEDWEEGYEDQGHTAYEVAGPIAEASYSDGLMEIYNKRPTLTVEVEGQMYTVDAVEIEDGAYGYGSFDGAFFVYPFGIAVGDYEGTLLYSIALYIPTGNTPSLSVYVAGEGGNDCGYHLNVVLNPPSDSLEITENGTYDVQSYDHVTVSTSGGGGECDITTVKFTVTNYTNDYLSFTVPYILESSNTVIDTSLTVNPSTTRDVEVPIYADGAGLRCVTNPDAVDGDITGVAPKIYLIKGDCQLTYGQSN